ncbi:MAG: hypothetical protein FWF97_04060 [Alphaproteobacteria bacterium]|nr:hypothetical protein [Alphaproteobacteria bacterium]
MNFDTMSNDALRKHIGKLDEEYTFLQKTFIASDTKSAARLEELSELRMQRWIKEIN